MATLTQQPIPKPFLSIFEKAGIVPKKYQTPEAFQRAFAKMSVDRIFEQLGVDGLFPGMHYRIIRITPRRIKYTNPREGVFRVIWKKEG